MRDRGIGRGEADRENDTSILIFELKCDSGLEYMHARMFTLFSPFFLFSPAVSLSPYAQARSLLWLGLRERAKRRSPRSCLNSTHLRRAIY